MALSLYDLCVPSYLQILGATEGFLGKAAKHFADTKTDANEIVEARLVPDMLPFRFQVVAVAHHSLGALGALKSGQFGPPSPSTADFAGLQTMIAEARAAVQKVTADEVNAASGKDILFSVGTMKIPFTAEGFIQTFSLPNFFFHATTAYDVLRLKGVPLGKRDFLGRMAVKS
ncbi:MAG: DUF1993 domain-containing protein [Reyranellaceae bacterium]